MRKKRILINTNFSKLFTGFGKNAKLLLKHLYADGRFELFEYCAGMPWGHPDLALQPWRANGTLPETPNEVNELNRDPGKARNASYGEYLIERAVKEFQPDVTLHIEDAWGVTFNTNKNFWGKIPSIFWVTQDSLPLIHTEDAAKTSHYWCWSGFATREFARLGHKHVKTQYPLVDLSDFKILSDDKKREIRRRFNISEHTFIISQVFRNQLRKLLPNQIEGYSMFKKQNPGASSILMLVTNFSEGWNIPKLAEQYGVPMSEVWCAYVSHETGDYILAPFQGNDIQCPFSGKDGAMHTVNVVKGVSDEALNEIYNISDVLSHPASSGAAELPIVEAAAAGKIILTPDYSYGEDVIQLNEGAFAMEWAKYTEIGTQFIKSSPFPFGIAKLFKKVYEMPKKKRDELGLLSRKWAKDNYDAELNGKKIANYLAALPDADWSKISLNQELKNDSFPFPECGDDIEFITTLYRNILKMPEEPHQEGHKHWQARLKEGMSRQAIYDFFIQTARQENAKNQVATQDFSALLDKTTGRKRALLVIRQSMGDCLMITQLLESFHQQYANHDLYIACEPRFAPVFAGNPHVFRVLQYHEFMENEMLCVGAGRPESEAYFSVYMHPAIQSQKQLNYLSADKIAHPIK